MSERDEDSERFYDLVYEAWRSGRNPDAVSRDYYDNFRAGANFYMILVKGYYSDEIMLDDVCPKHPKIEGNEEEE